jgi:YgiT-type zinc finger domain-containing protein
VIEMRCTVCEGDLATTKTDLPFKVAETAIVILKDLPVLACERCPEYLLEDVVLSRVDAILARVDRSAELEIIRYAA